MKAFLCLVLTVISCVAFATEQNTAPDDSANALSGIDLFTILLKHSDYSLINEPLCPPPATLVDPENYKLADQLSLLLATGHYSDTYAQLESICTTGKFEQPSGELVDVWDCQITIVETNANNEFVSSSTIALAISHAQKQMMAKSLRCL